FELAANHDTQILKLIVARQLRILPLKTPNLQYFRSRSDHDFVLEITVEGLSYVIENLPNLRLLSIDYYLALEYGEYVKIKRLCWRKGISFMHLAGRPNIVDE
uniref:Uncharacterized protein n=1 Tax=Romanomermis culicivorax TaxID=13658 RepID=A0A915KJR4_ROMCU